MSTTEHALRLLQDGHWFEIACTAVAIWRVYPKQQLLWQGDPCDLARVFEEQVAEIKRLKALERAYKASDLDISECMLCSQVVICVADGLPFCKACVAAELESEQ